MNHYQLGLMVSSYVDNFSTEIESSDKIRSIIDYTFETKTLSYFYKQISVFVILFAVPFFLVLFGNLPDTANRVMLSVALVGWIVMYSFEAISMYVEGFKNYLMSPWNLLD